MNIDPSFAAATVREDGYRGVSYIDSENGNHREVMLAPNEEFVLGPYSKNGEPRQPFVRTTDAEGKAIFTSFSEYLSARETAQSPSAVVQRAGELVVAKEGSINSVVDSMDLVYAKIANHQEAPEIIEKRAKAFNYENSQPTLVDKRLHEKLEAGEDAGFNVRMVSEETIRMIAGSKRNSRDDKMSIGSFLKGSSDTREGISLKELDDIDQFRFARMIQTARSVGLIVENMRVTNSPSTLAEVRLPTGVDLEHLTTSQYDLLPYNAKEQAKGTGMSVHKDREHTIVAARYLARFHDDYDKNPQKFVEDMEQVIAMAESGEIGCASTSANEFGHMSYLIQMAKGLGYELGEDIRYTPPSGNVVSGSYSVAVYGLKPGYNQDTQFMHEMRMRGQLPG